jgi:hypothetical protein
VTAPTSVTLKMLSVTCERELSDESRQQLEAHVTAVLSGLLERADERMSDLGLALKVFDLVPREPGQ